MHTAHEKTKLLMGKNILNPEAMKKIILILLMAMFSADIFASPATVNIQQLENAVPGSGLPVSVTANFSAVSGGVSALQFDITIADGACLTLSGLQNTAFSGIQWSILAGGTIRIIWSDNNAHSYLNGKLFDLVFTYYGGNSNLNFIPASSSVTASGAIPVATTYTNGWVHQVTATPGLAIANSIGQGGQTADVPLTVTQFYNVGGFTLKINFIDASVVTGTIILANINAAVSSVLTYNYSAGLLSITWTRPSGGNNVSVPDGTKLFDIEFTFAGGSSAINFNTNTSHINTNVYPYNPFTGVTYSNGAIALAVTVNTKAILQGAYNGTDMNTSLNSAGLIPLTQPYNTAPWNYAGTESVASIPNTNVVDWVLVELRTGTGSGTIVANGRQAGFVQKDGTIVGLDGVNPLIFYGLTAGNYYIVVRHRNHLPVMSTTAQALNTASFQYDFTSAVAKAYGTNQLAILTGGKFGLWGGGCKFKWHHSVQWFFKRSCRYIYRNWE